VTTVRQRLKAAVSSADWISSSSTNGLNSSKQTVDGGWFARQTATLTVSDTSIHTVNIWMREDGFQIDKIVLTTDRNYTPSGVGPEKSPRSY
jgi:hypothetical protein